MANRFLSLLPHQIARFSYASLRPSAYRNLMARKHATNGYTYRSFYENQCIFVHIPKAAGVSVCKTLFGNLAGGHTDIGIYRLAFSRRDFKQYFKFTIVRNPWDRLFSAYNFLKAGGYCQEDKQWANNNIAQYETFTDFVTHWISNKENLCSYWHFKPQHHFVCHPFFHRIEVDFVGLYENLDADFAYIQQKIFGDTSRSLRAENITASKEKQDYKEVYTDQTQEIVRQAYQKDIEIFGYSFDNSSLATQIANRKV